MFPQKAANRRVVQGGTGKLYARHLRLVSGMILLLFSAMHLINLAFGLHSVEALDRASLSLMAPWGSRPGTMLLLAAVVVHIGMGLFSITQRRSLAMTRTDWVQMTLGIVIMPLLLNHLMIVGVLRQIFPQFQPDFYFLLVLYWKYSPIAALQQILVLVILWVHGAIGFYQWLVLKPVWTRLGSIVTPTLFLIPILALLGFVEAGKDALMHLDTMHVGQQKIDLSIQIIAQAKPELNAIQHIIYCIYGLLVVTALAVMTYKIVRHYGKPVTIVYDNGVTVSAKAGLSILDMSLMNGVPHASVCGGRGRCGTCVVAVQQEHALLSPIQEIEAHTLTRLSADKNMRLGCQARLLAGTLNITRLQPVFVDAEASRQRLPMDAETAVIPGDIA